MTEVLFYQLSHQSLEAVLPVLIVRSVSRGWRVVVQGASEERIKVLDDLLWTFSDESFLPHGLSGQNDVLDQPVILTTGSGNPNGATVRFLIDNVIEPDDTNGYERLVILFDGRFDDSLAAARQQWKRCREKGLNVTYWAQSDDGRWEKKA